MVLSSQRRRLRDRRHPCHAGRCGRLCLLRDREQGGVLQAYRPHLVDLTMETAAATSTEASQHRIIESSNHRIKREVPCQPPPFADENREAMRTTSTMCDSNASSLVPAGNSSNGVQSPPALSQLLPKFVKKRPAK